MQKVKTPLALLSVLVMAVIFFSGLALAAEVTKVHIGKGHISIDRGKSAGFTMGAEVCFYSFSGEKIACGKVRRTSDNIAMVEIKSREAKKIKKGMAARLVVSKTSEKTD